MEEPEVKKAWSKPELIVIVRSSPEEVVLGSCKYTAGSGYSGPTDQRTVCYNGPCVSCSTQGSS